MCKINGKKLAEIRVEKGISQNKLANEIGKSSSLIGKYESNLINPSDETVGKICMFLNINKKEIEVPDIGYDFLAGESKIVAKTRKSKSPIKTMTPKMAEDLISTSRTFDETREIEEVKVAVNNCFGINPKRYILIDPTLIHIPLWQRNIDMTKVMEITENFNDIKFDPVKVYVSNGKLKVADGSHRLVSFVLRKAIKIQAEILNCNEHEAILAFLEQSSARKAMSIPDMYRAAVKANVPEYIEFKNFFESYNIQISVEDKKLKNPIGKITPSRLALRYVVRDTEILDKTVNLIKRLEWCGSTNKNVFTNRIFAVFKKLYANYGDSIEEKLMKNCFGVVYFEGKVSAIKSNAELYDMLSAEIKKGD